MKRFTIFSLTCFLSMGSVFAQQGVTQCGVPTGQPKFPLQAYQELPDPAAPSEKEWAAVTAPQVSWGTIDVRYAKHQLPALKKTTNTSLKGWRGERVNAQAVVWTGTELKDLNFSFTDFKDKKGNSLSGDALTAGFVRYVMTDELNKDGRGACGYRKSVDFDSLLVADPIDSELKTMALPARTVQPIWVQCWIPQSAVPGTYKGQLLVNDGSNLLQRLNLEITVSSRVLPQPSEWAFHLDLWQSPYAVARYYQVPLWSQEHLDAMRPLMKMLANAGQKIITATLTHKPWNGQTEDYFDTMVTWIKRADGTWTFDYTIFDRWVEFMMSVGIDKQINCYSMVPWKLSFQYYDQATNSLKFVKTAPGEQAYEEMWVAMLASFAKHLKEKGWFDICTIAMDERPMDVMQKTLKVIRKADPDFKVSLAGNYHAEIEPDLYDYCIVIGQNYPEDVRLRRKAENHNRLLPLLQTRFRQSVERRHADAHADQQHLFFIEGFRCEAVAQADQTFQQLARLFLRHLLRTEANDLVDDRQAVLIPVADTDRPLEVGIVDRDVEKLPGMGDPGGIPFQFHFIDLVGEIPVGDDPILFYALSHNSSLILINRRNAHCDFFQHIQ